MKIKSILLSILISSTVNSLSQKIDIGIFQHLKTSKILIEANTGKYKIKSGNKTLYRLKSDRSVIVNLTKNYISISNSKKDFGLHKEVEIVAKRYKFSKSHSSEKSKKNCELNISLISPKQSVRTYQGNIRINLNEKELELVNQLSLPDYLAGVVEAESGSKEVAEYYKNQSVICRTYAMATLNKHKSEGFNLCDGVHCQAYKGKSSSNPMIQKAVKDTKGLVIVDKNDQLISALFSANCGGQTNNSEDVWSTALAYLRSIKDIYCTDQRQARWTKTINLKEWQAFLKDKSINVSDTFAIDSIHFEQPVRQKYYLIDNKAINLTDIRFGLKLRSTFFNIVPEKDHLVFQGRGYGHGVGMCQEGAMNMAKKGHKYDEIIKYYYSGVKIKSIKDLKNKGLNY